MTTFEVFRDELKVVITRTFNASAEAIFKAYTDPELVAKWWGQNNSETIIDKMDVTVGGTWRYIQREPNGNEHPFHGTYKEIVPNTKLTYTFVYEPIGDDHELTETVTLEEKDGKTLLTNTSYYNTIEDLEGMVASGMEGGARESIERLAALVE